MLLTRTLIGELRIEDSTKGIKLFSWRLRKWAIRSWRNANTKFFKGAAAQ